MSHDLWSSASSSCQPRASLHARGLPRAQLSGLGVQDPGPKSYFETRGPMKRPNHPTSGESAVLQPIQGGQFLNERLARPWPPGEAARKKHQPKLGSLDFWGSSVLEDLKAGSLPAKRWNPKPAFGDARRASPRMPGSQFHISLTLRILRKALHVIRLLERA